MNALALHPASLTTSTTPAKDKLLSINFLENQSLLIIKGWSVTPELKIVYSVLLEEIQNHLATHEGITINFEYKIFNAFTTRFLFQAIKTLNAAVAKDKPVAINWIVEENHAEIYDMGMDMQGLCDFDFSVSLKHHTISPSFN